MCGQRTDSFFLLIALLLLTASGPAFAKKNTFDNRSGVGFSFRGGATVLPQTDFVVRPQSATHNYSTFAGFDPFVDFGNFVIRGQVTAAIPPDVQGSGAGFTEKSESVVLMYGGQLQLVPFINQARTARLYMAGGLGLATIYLTNTRVYSSGGTQTSYTSRARTTVPYTSAALGFETFLVQNYVFQLEGGYRNLRAHELNLTTSGDVRGQTPGNGSVARDDVGTPQSYSFSGIYASIAFSLMF